LRLLLPSSFRDALTIVAVVFRSKEFHSYFFLKIYFPLQSTAQPIRVSAAPLERDYSIC
jgi:hypothetical protein